MLSAVLRLRLVELRRFLRPLPVALLLATAAVLVVIERATGFGAASPHSRPGAHASATVLLLDFTASAFFTGLVGPSFLVRPAEAQWVVTGPRGPGSLVIANRLAGVALGASGVAVTTAAAQVTSGRLAPLLVGQLVLWVVGFQSAVSVAGVLAADSYAGRPHGLRLRLLVGAAGLASAAAVAVLPGAGRVADVLSRPVRRVGWTSLAGALAWDLLALLLFRLMLDRAEHLVADAVAAGERVASPSAGADRMPAARMREPDRFRLAGGGAFLWLALVVDRRLATWQLRSAGVALVASGALAWWAPRYAFAVPLGLFAVVTLRWSNDRGALVSRYLRLLPVPTRQALLCDLGYRAVVLLRSLLPSWLLVLALGRFARGVTGIVWLCALPGCLALVTVRGAAELQADADDRSAARTYRLCVLSVVGGAAALAAALLPVTGWVFAGGAAAAVLAGAGAGGAWLAARGAPAAA